MKPLLKTLSDRRLSRLIQTRQRVFQNIQRAWDMLSLQLNVMNPTPHENIPQKACQLVKLDPALFLT